MSAFDDFNDDVSDVSSPTSYDDTFQVDSAGFTESAGEMEPEDSGSKPLSVPKLAFWVLVAIILLLVVTLGVQKLSGASVEREEPVSTATVFSSAEPVSEPSEGGSTPATSPATVPAVSDSESEPSVAGRFEGSGTVVGKTTRVVSGQVLYVVSVEVVNDSGGSAVVSLFTTGDSFDQWGIGDSCDVVYGATDDGELAVLSVSKN